MPLRRLAAFVLIAFFAAPRGFAADVPVAVQLALFTNVWKLDRNFGAHAVVRVGVVYQESNAPSVAIKDAAVKWITAQPGLAVVPIALDTAEGKALLSSSEVDVFYVTRMRGADLSEIARVARARNIRTMTGVPEYVRHGLAVGVGVRNDRPLIIVNLGAAVAEGAAYQAQLLKLAELVR